METSKVYILTDEHGRILRCEGGYTMSNISGEGWVLIDEGNGDRFNLCQSHYFDSLYDDDGVCRYVYENGAVLLRSSAEIAAEKRTKSAVIAPRNITAGEYITVDGILYRATANIPNGGAIITGQNAEETTVEALLYELTKKGAE